MTGSLICLNSSYLNADNGRFVRWVGAREWPTVRKFAAHSESDRTDGSVADRVEDDYGHLVRVVEVTEDAAEIAEDFLATVVKLAITSGGIDGVIQQMTSAARFSIICSGCPAA